MFVSPLIAPLPSWDLLSFNFELIKYNIPLFIKILPSRVVARFSLNKLFNIVELPLLRYIAPAFDAELLLKSESVISRIPFPEFLIQSASNQFKLFKTVTGVLLLVSVGALA